MEFIRSETTRGLSVITIDRPKALNALNADVLMELRSCILSLQETRVLILTGAGEKTFVAGADIQSMSGMTPMQARAFVELGQGVMRMIEEAPFISIAAVNGFALGGGLELAMSCDLVYSSANAKFGAPETNLGIIPGFGGTLNIAARAGFHRAMDLILTGRIISAEEAKSMNLVLEIFPPSEFTAKVREIAEKLTKKGIQSLLAAKRLIRSVCANERERAYLLERETFATLFATGEPKEGMAAFLEKRDPKFTH